MQNEETVTFTFNKMKQFLTIAIRGEIKYDFVTIGIDSMINYKDILDIVTQFMVNGVTIASTLKLLERIQLVVILDYCQFQFY